MSEERLCPDCGVEPGEKHWEICDVARCVRCGGQFISCACPYDEGDGDRYVDRWSGEWPGLADCRRFGLWCVRNPDGPGYLPVPEGTPGAVEDLNRLTGPMFKWVPATGSWERSDVC